MRDNSGFTLHALATLVLAAGAAVPIPAYGQPFQLDTTVVTIPAQGWQSSAAVCDDGVISWVFWTDERTGLDADVYTARVARTGAVLDSVGFPVCVETGNQELPAAAGSRESCLVVWSDWRDGMESNIYGARLASQGSLLDSVGIQVSSAEGNQTAPAVASGLDEYLVAWEDYRHGHSEVYCARVTKAGVVLDPGGMPVVTGEWDRFHPAVAFDGRNFTVVWEDRRGSAPAAYAARVSPYGAVLDSSGICLSSRITEQSVPSIAFGDSTYLIVWQGAEPGHSDRNIYGTRLTPDGIARDSIGLLVGSGPGKQRSPAVAFDGTLFDVAWERDSERVYYARVTPAGVVLDSPGNRLTYGAMDAVDPAAISIEGTCLIAWQRRFQSTVSDICGKRFDQSGRILDTADIVISRSADAHPRIALAQGPRGVRAFWYDQRYGYNGAIRSCAVTVAGPAPPASITTFSTPGANGGPVRAAFGGGVFLAVWAANLNGDYDIYGVRLDTTGAVLDSFGFLINGAYQQQTSPAVAFDGTNFLAVWEDAQSANLISGARVSPTGCVLDTQELHISTGPSGDFEPSLAFGGANYLVVWVDWEGNHDISAARVSPAGVVIDTQRLRISRYFEDEWSPSVVLGDSNYFVVWERYFDIACARITPSGTILDPNGAVVCAHDGQQRHPSAFFDGSDFLVVWDDARGGDYDVLGARVNCDCIVTDSFKVIAQPGNQQGPLVLNAPGLGYCVAYAGWTGAYGGRAYNATRVWAKTGPLAGIESEQRPRDGEHARRPASPVLFDPRPNPANTSVAVPYSLASTAEASVGVYNSTGQLITVLTNGRENAGYHYLRWGRTDPEGRSVPAGVYFVRLDACGQHLSTKVVLTE